MIYKLEEMDLHDIFISKIKLDFVNKSLELEVQFVDEKTDEIISRIISFKNVKEIKNIDFPSLNASCELNHFVMEDGDELKYHVNIVVLTGHGAPSWIYHFECSTIVW